MISLKDMALLKEDNQFCDCCLTIASVRNLGDVSFIIGRPCLHMVYVDGVACLHIHYVDAVSCLHIVYVDAMACLHIVQVILLF